MLERLFIAFKALAVLGSGSWWDGRFCTRAEYSLWQKNS